MSDGFVVTEDSALGSASGSPLCPAEHFLPLSAMYIADARGIYLFADSFESCIAIVKFILIVYISPSIHPIHPIVFQVY